MKKVLLYIFVLATLSAFAESSAPTMTQCEGSLMPYPAPTTAVAVPDSLEPVFINHVGRHGARFPASAANCLALKRVLEQADSAATLTRLGRRLQQVNDYVIAVSTNRWGALDSLGMAEQQGIATRMFYNFTEVFSKEGTIKSLSSYSPRAMMSMFAFVHQLDRMNNRNTFTTSTGRVNSELLRPFDTDADYLAFRKAKTWEPPYQTFYDATCPTEPIVRAIGNVAGSDPAVLKQLSLTEYYVIAGLEAMGLPSAMEEFFTPAEARALWSCFNLRQYLQRTATTLTTVPADIASKLLLDIIETTDAFIGGDTSTTAVLRFGHAETLMPLLSLMRMPGCYYLTNYFDTVAEHWRDFYVVPMASNVQFILFKSKTMGRFYMRVDLNEHPVALRQGDDAIYFPWKELRRHLMNCVPLYAQ